MKDITYIINRSEITAGTRGASLGPGAVMTAARKDKNFLFGEFPVVELPDSNYMLDQAIKYPHAKRIEGLIQVYKNVSSEVKKVLSQGRFPLILAGDHGSAGGSIAGVKAAHPDKRLGVVWIDAHGDLHTPYTTPSGNMHGMPLSTALNDDNLEVQRNELDEETKLLWEKLKSTGVAGAKINAEDLVFIGVRDVEEEEVALMKRRNIKNFSVEEVNELGAEKVVQQIDDKLADCDMIYVSFDVDSMDPKVTSHGTGTPVDNGILPEHASAFLKAFARNEKTKCIEFVEVNPCLDEKINTMGEVAFKLVEEVVNELKK